MTESTPAAPASAPHQRVRWVDDARGIGIFLVVLYHVIAGLKRSEVFQYPEAYAALCGWLRFFVMPTFFLLAGLFASRGAGRPWKDFLTYRFKTVAYPYLIWAGLQTCVRALLSGYTNKTESFASVLWMFVNPPGQFWFLYVLFVILVVHACAFKLRIGPVPFLVLSVLFYASVAVIPLGWAVGAAVRAYMMYFALGNVLGATGALTRMRSLGTPALAVIAIAGHALIWGGSYFNWDETYVGRPIGAVLGVSGTIAASMLLERVSWSRVIDLWGRRSMEIYVVHVIALAAVRLFLLNVLGWRNLPAHFLLGMIAGLHIPIAVWWGAERIGFPYLFSLQRRRSSLQEKGA